MKTLKNCSKNIFVFVLLCSTFFLGSFLEASDKFDSNPEYALKIQRSYGVIKPNLNYSPCWMAINYINFENGFWSKIITDGNIFKRIDAEWYAEREFSGISNIACTNKGRFELLLEDGSKVRLSTLYFNKEHPRNNPLYVQSITENLAITSHWYGDSKKYRFVIELSDGSIWATQGKKNPWELPLQWEIGVEVVKFGTTLHPALLNINALTETTSWERSRDWLSIEEHQYLINLERLN